MRIKCSKCKGTGCLVQDEICSCCDECSGQGYTREKMSSQTKGKIRQALIGNQNAKGKLLENKNGMWKGNNVGYTALHNWVKRKIQKPSLCENCHAKEPHDLANRSGKYLRDLSDWEWLCRSCHMKKDGRIEKLHSSPKDGTNNGFFGKKHSRETKRKWSSLRKILTKRFLRDEKGRFL